MHGGPAGSMYSVSDSGWMEAANFKQCFAKMFIPAVKHLTTKHPVLLVFDGHHSHISLDLIKLASYPPALPATSHNTSSTAIGR